MKMDSVKDKTIIELENCGTDTADDEDVKEHVTKRKKCLKVLKNNLLMILLILSMGAGIGLGAGVRMVEPPFTSRQIKYLKFPGDLLMNMLKLLILPLIVSSLISGLASLDTRASGRMGLRAIVYYLTTTLSAVILGIILTVSIRPGSRGSEPDSTGSSKVVNTLDTFLDLFRQCFPDNLVEACFSKRITKQVEKTELVNKTVVETNNITHVLNTSQIVINGTEDINKTVTETSIWHDAVLTQESGMNVLGLVVFSIFFGIIIGRMGQKGKPLLDFFDSLSEATMQLIRLVIWYSPIGIMFLIGAEVVKMQDPEKTFQQLLYYFITVICGLVIHGFVTLPLLYLVIVRKNPFRFIYGVTQAIVTALGTSSSSATLPITMRCLEENNGVDSRITKFVAPVGATINMDGTALYEAVAVLFIGQVRGFDLNIGQIIIVSITSTAAAIGAAGVPQAGLVTMVIVLTAVGFPTDDVTLVIAIDWLLDRFRTAVNVLGDAIGAGIVHHLSKKELQKLDELDTKAKENGQIANGHINEAFQDYKL